ncbi:hypothetical protein P3J6_120202 [Pseudoalteromonas sp. 3J6]|nr:hypothetical protein P3J6_120202 [Pseudoalteromonas sp. 3J6]
MWFSMNIRFPSHNHNKAFKSDSQRLALSLRSSIAKRRSHLNAALYNKEIKVEKYAGDS